MARVPKAAAGKKAATARPRGTAAAAKGKPAAAGRPPRAPKQPAQQPQRRKATTGTGGGAAAEKTPSAVMIDARPQLRELEANIARAADEVVREKIIGKSAEAVASGKATLANVDRARREALESAESTFDERHLSGAKAVKEHKPMVKRVDQKHVPTFEERHLSGANAVKERKPMVKRVEQTLKALEDAMEQATAAIDKTHQAWAKRCKTQLDKMARTA
ncbi:hypothetical protein JKP88DRAFT_353877 [Tribonema minus]|uniref:Uncharacterized protein n=1 Tax=Tribonema minus TaxID=303371 RepID=A0A835ZAS7_9STRA|nr:hypothetical protein JKP88DRAFT_353877 [Tribonema minus]